MKIAVVSSNDRQATEIVRVLRTRSPSDEVQLVAGMPQVLAAGAGGTTPDVLVLDAPSIGEGDLDQLERLSHVHPRLAFIVLTQQSSRQFLMRAMRAGVREVMPLPLNGDALCAAIQRIDDKRGSQSQTHGKVLAFISCKGGSGATFLATNLGYALATLKDKRVALIDLNLQFGDASLLQRHAICRHRAGGTFRPAAAAYARAQIHHALGIGLDAGSRQPRFGERPQLRFHGLVARPSGYAGMARQYAFYIAVQNRTRLPKSERSNRGGSRATDAGQALQSLDILRELAVVAVA